MNRETRREFLKTAAVAGAAWPWVTSSGWTAAAGAEPGPAQIENEFLSVGFDAQAGRLSCWRRDGAPLLSGVVARANLKNASRSTAEPAYRRAIEVVPCRDRLGSGRQLIARCADDARQLNFEMRVTLYEARPAVLIEVECRNVSSQALVLR